MTTLPKRITCHFCDRTTRGVEAAIGEGWIPSFFEVGDEHETCNPVCPMCQEVFLEQDDDGEMVYSPERDHRPQYGEQARRIAAAAPDLLAALEELLAMCERQDDFNDDGDGEMFDRARAAIAKARGEV